MTGGILYFTAYSHIPLLYIDFYIDVHCINHVGLQPIGLLSAGYASDYRTNGLYRTHNPNNPFIR